VSQTSVATVVGSAKISRFHLKAAAICALLMIADGYDLVSFGSVIPHLMKDWGTDPLTLGVVGSMALAGMFAGGLMVAPLADKYGRRKLIVAGLILASIAAFACAFADTPLVLGALRFVVGVALGALVPNFMALTGELSPTKSKAFFVATVSAFYAVGGVGAALLAIYIEPVLGWRGVFYVAGLSILLVPVVLKHLPESPEYLALVGQRERLDAVMKQIEPSWSPNTVIALPAPSSGKSRIAQLFTHGNALATSLMWVFFIMTMVLSYALNTWLPKLMQNAGFELGPAMWTLVILNAGGLFGSIAGGWIAGRTSYRKTLVGYFALAIVSLVLLSIKPNAFMLNVLLFTAGAAVIGILAIIHAFAVEFYPVHIRSTGVGWATGTGRIGAIAGPILGGALVAAGLPLQMNFVLLTIPAVLGVTAVIIVTARRFKSAATKGEKPVLVP
jgi:AAHS family benzoate transporter-like MFS transporter